MSSLLHFPIILICVVWSELSSLVKTDYIFTHVSQPFALRLALQSVIFHLHDAFPPQFTDLLTN